LRASAGRGHRVRGLSRPLKDEQSPSSTRLEHPVVTDACARALVCPSLRVSRRPILERPPREGRTHRGGPECFPSPGPKHIEAITRLVRSTDLSHAPPKRVVGGRRLCNPSPCGTVLDGVGTGLGLVREGFGGVWPRLSAPRTQRQLVTSTNEDFRAFVKITRLLTALFSQQTSSCFYLQ
jgi:hypothetical protein